ncbi:Glutaconyl-CoA decarboxylase subunit gamma [compost metagenome]
MRSSMPGSVWKILVEAGDEVKKGDTLLIEESMKMEFNQISPCDGIVSSIHVSPGEEVHAGQLVIGLKVLAAAEI